jgi:hypothetical protein
MNTPYESFSIGEIGAGIILANGLSNQVRVEYIPGILNVYMNNLVTPLLSVPYDFNLGAILTAGIPVGGLNLPTGNAFVGFTGGCGGLSQSTVIETWTWVSAASTIFTLGVTQPSGPGSVRLEIVNGIPFARYITAVTFDPTNGTSPGTGWWGGLHIALPDLIIQYGTGAPPFTGFLDSVGGAVFSLPGGSLISGLPTVYGVSRTTNGAVSTITGTTAVTVNTLL